MLCHHQHLFHRSFCCPCVWQLHFSLFALYSSPLTLYLGSGIVLSHANGFASALMLWRFPPSSFLCLAQTRRLWALLAGQFSWHDRAVPRGDFGCNTVSLGLCSFLGEELHQPEGSFAQTPWVRKRAMQRDTFILNLRSC